MQQRRASIFVALKVQLIFLTTVAAYTFQLILDEDYQPCKGLQNLDLNALLDVSGIEWSRGPNNEMVMNGNMVWGAEMKADELLSFQVDCKSNDRGRLVSSPFVYLLKDFCAVEFEPGKAWDNLTKFWTSKEQRTCPPAKGTILPVKNAQILPRYTIPVRMKEGEYACNIHARANDRTLACFIFKGEVHVLSQT